MTNDLVYAPLPKMEKKEISRILESEKGNSDTKLRALFVANGYYESEYVGTLILQAMSSDDPNLRISSSGVAVEFMMIRGDTRYTNLFVSAIEATKQTLDPKSQDFEIDYMDILGFAERFKAKH